MKKKFRLAFLALLALCVSAGAACGSVGDGDSQNSGSSSGSAEETSSVSLNRETLEIDRFGEGTLTAEITGSGTVEWSSSDEKVVTVDGGRVVATGVGTAVVTATLAGTNISDTCTVTVTEATELPVLTLDKTSVSVLKGGTLTVTPTVRYRGEEVEGAVYTWTIDDTGVATVADGVVTGVSAGSAKLSVQAVWKGETLVRTIDVFVNADASVSVTSGGEAVTSVTLRTSLPEGVDPDYITEIVLSAAAYEGGKQVEDPTIVWTLTGDAVTLENGKVTASKEGSATVRAAYTTTEGDEVYADVEITVVLPDIDSDVQLEADKTASGAPLDFSAITSEEVVGLEYNGTDILVDGAINADWLALQSDGTLPVQVITQTVVYNVQLSVFTRYIAPDLGDTSVVNIVESTGNRPLGGIWSAAGETDEPTVGDTDGVFKYELTDGIGAGEAFSYRVELSDLASRYGTNNGYILFDLFVPEGQPGAAGWGSRGGDLWIDWLVGRPLSADKGFYIGADGIKTDVLRAGEWTTVVVPSGTLGLSRFAIMSAGGNDVTYYIRDMRLYAADKWNTPYLTAGLSEIVLEEGETYEFSGDEFAGLYLGANEADAISEILLSGGDEEVVTTGGAVITAVGGGSSAVLVTVRIGNVSLTTSVNVVVAQEVSPVDIDRAATGTLASADIKGTIERVEYEGEIVAESADISEFLKTIEGCSLGAPAEKIVTVVTDEGVYSVTLRVVDTKDYVDKTGFEAVNNGGAANLWSVVDTYEGKQDVRHYNSAKEDGTAVGITIWNSRINFNNNAVYSRYDYMTMDIFVPEGSSFGLLLGQGGATMYSLTDGTEIGTDVYPFAFDAKGTRLETFRTGEWVTIAVPTAVLLEQRCAFGQADNAVYEYYVGEMRLYTRENFEGAFDVPKLEPTVTLDKSDTNVFKVVDSNSIQPWEAAGTYEGKENAWHYSSDKGDGTADGITVWNARVDFHNNALYSQYAYLAVDFFVAEGSSMGMFLGGPAGSVHSLTDGTALGTQAYAYAFDAEGNRMETFRTGEWVTVLVPASMLTAGRCAFGEADNVLCDYYVGDMVLYTQAAFEETFDVTAE